MTRLARPVRIATLVVSADDTGRRLDEFLARTLAVGRRTAVRLAARARVDGRAARKGDRVRSGEVVVVPHADGATDTPAEGPLTVVRETLAVLVLDKPAALPSVALRGAGGDSLAARIARHFPECADLGRPGESGLVHRLDTGTSGLLLAARTADAYASLRAQFRAHTVAKEYLALVAGRLERPLCIDAPIGQHRAARSRVRALATTATARRYAARPACTNVTPERVFDDATLVRARTTTGARHQIRVHLAGAGHPLLGDPLYGASTPGPAGFLLHASRIEWLDPVTGAAQSDDAPLPETWSARTAQPGHAALPRAGGGPR